MTTRRAGDDDDDADDDDGDDVAMAGEVTSRETKQRFEYGHPMIGCF